MKSTNSKHSSSRTKFGFVCNLFFALYTIVVTTVPMVFIFLMSCYLFKVKFPINNLLISYCLIGVAFFVFSYRIATYISIVAKCEGAMITCTKKQIKYQQDELDNSLDGDCENEYKDFLKLVEKTYAELHDAYKITLHKNLQGSIGYVFSATGIVAIPIIKLCHINVSNLSYALILAVSLIIGWFAFTTKNKKMLQCMVDYLKQVFGIFGEFVETVKVLADSEQATGLYDECVEMLKLLEDNRSILESKGEENNGTEKEI